MLVELYHDLLILASGSVLRSPNFRLVVQYDLLVSHSHDLLFLETAIFG